MTLQWCIAEAVREDFIAEERVVDELLVPELRKKGHAESEVTELIEDTRVQKKWEQFNWVKQWELVQQAFPRMCNTINDGHNTRVGKYLALTNTDGSVREELKGAFLFRIVCGKDLEDIFFCEIASILAKLAKENRWGTRRWKLRYIYSTGETVVERIALDEHEEKSGTPWVKARVSGRSFTL